MLKSCHWIKSITLLLLIFGVIVITQNSFAQAEPLKIGVLSKRGHDKTIEKWQQTARFLSNKIKGFDFKIVPLEFGEIAAVVEGETIDFLLANPSIYVEMETLYGVSRIATLKNLGPAGHALTTFGGVIITKADRNDLHTLTDLKKISTFMAVKENSLGGFQLAWFELKKAGVDPYSDFEKLLFRSKHDSVVFAVLNGEVDAGTIRTDTLERMASEGKINMDDVKIINSMIREDTKDYPYKISTQLAPEWPMAKLAHTSDAIAQEVTIALLKMQADDPAALTGKNAGWTVPRNYQPIRLLMQELQIGPFRHFGQVSLSQLFFDYWQWVLIFTALLLSLIVLLSYILKINAQHKKAEEILRLEVNERQIAEQTIIEDRKKLQEEVDRHTKALAYLEKIHKYHKLTSLLITTIDPRILLQKALDRVVELSESAVGGIYLLDSKNNKIRPYVFHAVGEEAMRSVSLSESIPSQVITDKTFRHIKKMQEDCEIKVNFGLGEVYPNELLIFPMLSKDKALGVIILGTIKHFSDEDIQVLIHMSDQISIMLENALANDEMKELVDTKELLNRQLEYEIDVRNRFFSIISHDLTSPFQVILGFTKIMSDAAHELSRDKLADHATRVHNSGKRVMGLLQNLLEWASLQMGAVKMEPEEIALHKLVQESIDLLLPTARKKNILLINKIEQDARVFADYQMVLTIIRNLIINSIKFTSFDGSVELTSRKVENMNQVTVSDTGIGISEDNIKTIFALDQQTSTLGTNKETGTGLGLPLCKELLKQNGGHIRVDSIPGKGSQFHFTLPIASGDKTVSS